MNVDFNNLRKQAANTLDELTKKLNSSIIQNDDQYANPNEVYHHQCVNLKGYVLIDAESIQHEMNGLRSMIISIACTYDPDDSDFKDLTGEIFENGGVADFNINEE